MEGNKRGNVLWYRATTSNRQPTGSVAFLVWWGRKSNHKQSATHTQCCLPCMMGQEEQPQAIGNSRAVLPSLYDGAGRAATSNRQPTRSVAFLVWWGRKSSHKQSATHEQCYRPYNSLSNSYNTTIPRNMAINGATILWANN